MGTAARRFLVLMLLVGMCPPSHADWQERRAALSEMHGVAEFRIFYARSGPDALREVEDANRNGTPDYVERIARELISARTIYDEQIRLRHPLTSLRYKGQAEFIDVNLLSFPLTPNGPKHGIAYDELSSFGRARDAGRKVRVLVMDISSALAPTNATAAHELFHLYQNGYTFFKNRWYTEGTARWAEDHGTVSAAKAGQWPRSATEIRALFQQKYETASFWHRLALKLDRAGDGTFVRAFFEELDRADDAINPSSNWREADQMSAANDIHIWRALRATLVQPAFRARWDEDIQALMAIEL